MSTSGFNAKDYDIKLLPCPFCGSDNIEGPHRELYSGDYYEPWWSISCMNDDCCSNSFNLYDSIEDPMAIVDKWNNRYNYVDIELFDDIVLVD